MPVITGDAEVEFPAIEDGEFAPIRIRLVAGSFGPSVTTLVLWLRDRPAECFSVVFVDSQHRVIAARELFRGTLTQTAVYPREVARQALQLNAAAVILAHNHPSGVAEPSTADRLLTDTLRAALGQLDIAVLDHLIVAGNQCVSFAERGWL